MLCKKCCLKILQSLQKKHLCWSLVFNKVTGQRHSFTIELLIHFLHHLHNAPFFCTTYTMCSYSQLESLVIVSSLPISYLIFRVVVMVCKKTQNQTRQESILKLVKVDGFYSLIQSQSRIFMLQICQLKTPQISHIIFAVLLQRKTSFFHGTRYPLPTSRSIFVHQKACSQQEFAIFVFYSTKSEEQENTKLKNSKKSKNHFLT